MRKIWDLPGGVHPPENKHQSLKLPLDECPLADEFILPLNQHIGAPATPCVAVGDEVKKYQRIADAQGVFSAHVHAPTSGEIVAIEDRLIAHPSGLSALCIVLKADGEDTAESLSPCEAPFALDAQSIVNTVREAGIAGLGGAGFPAAVKLNPRADMPIDTLIINGTECEPYITADDTLMQYHAEELVQGTLLMRHALGNPKTVLIGIEDNKPKAITAVTAAAKGTAAEVVSFPTKYPSGGEKQLIYILTGKEVTSGQIPASLGIVMQNVGTAVAAWRAVRFGEPLVDRITTLVGEALDTQRNMRVRLGTPVEHLLAQNGFQPHKAPRLIIGGPMMGFALEQTQVPVVKTTNCLIAPSHQEMPEAPEQQPCIRCGHCAEACPAGLLPQQLYWYADAGDQDKLRSHNLFDCIECGACSYVCPSAIPLVQYYRNAKGTIRQTEADKQKADKARLRFERRKERIAEAEAAKEAKRQARKAAAERNKTKLAQEQNADASLSSAPNTTRAGNTDSTASNGGDDRVAQAMREAKTRKAEKTPEQERAKLMRTRDSLSNTIARLQEQINDASGDASRIATFTARLKQTQLKLKEAENKLVAFEEPKDNSAALQKVAPPAITTQGTEDTAVAAIERAKAKAQSLTMATAEEKQAATIASLEKRLEKATSRLQKAQENSDDNLEAFAAGVEKLEKKLQDARLNATTR